MKKSIFFTVSALCLCAVMYGQDEDTQNTDYKKRVLESTEVDILSSYYKQTGNNAAVTGGVGNERLTDVTPTIVVNIPLNADDVLTFDAGISAYSSASSSNLDPFDRTGASAGYDDDDDDGGSGGGSSSARQIVGSPWVASSGASAQDVWGNVTIGYSHNSDDRNQIWDVNASFSAEYDYTSIGLGAGYSRLFNEKNTEIAFKAKVFADTWSPRYPTELDTFLETGGNLNASFFNNVDILDATGNATVKTGSNTWNPGNFALISDKSRNTYSGTFSFSQILSKKAQFALFFDVVYQSGWLANPMQRVYFSDRENFFIGNANSISEYQTPANRDVFMLGDDIERLPENRLKVPVGARFHYYFNETFTLRTYYRYYFDDWGIRSHTLQAEIPIKISSRFTLYPTYRYYTQTAADYFGAFDTHLSTDAFYTSDYDLSDYKANQFGLGVSYTDIFTGFRIYKLGLKSIDLRYNHYDRDTGLTADIISAGFKFVVD